ncbi:MAG TPA: PEGA domain-containing protein [Opitutaceae bacterium]|nr:PEGA domain-containing protein [Opitutaceae bacterium]
MPQPILAPQAAPAAPVVAKPTPPQPSSVLPGTPPPRVPSPVVAPAPAKNEFVLAIESEPAGAIIVVNNTPVGKAPLKLAIKGTPLGFFRDYVMVKARFLATSLTETSITVEEDCTPLEKIPGKLVFTPQGAQRRQP